MKKNLVILLSLCSILFIQTSLYIKSADNYIIDAEKVDNNISLTTPEEILEEKESPNSEDVNNVKKETKETNTAKAETNTTKKETIQTKKEVVQSKPASNNASKQENNIVKKEEPKKLTELESIAEKKDKLGTVGRLYLPSVNFNVAVYEANAYKGEEYNAQKIVDAKDSAAHFYLGGKAIIADHNYQGFKKIMNLKIGDKAYVKKADGTIEIYQIKEKFIGKNTGTDIVNSEGVSIANTEQDLVMYTCYTDDGDITITRWDRVLE